MVSARQLLQLRHFGADLLAHLLGLGQWPGSQGLQLPLHLLLEFLILVLGVCFSLRKNPVLPAGHLHYKDGAWR